MSADVAGVAPAPPAPSRKGRGRFAQLSGLDAVALLLSLTLVVPIVSVCLSLFSGQSDVFVHLAETALPEYAANTVLLTLLVVIGVLAVGVPAAWLTAMCEFPGRRFLEDPAGESAQDPKSTRLN